MPVRFRTFWLPRYGYRPDEYEDAFALDPANGRYAVADGATESSFAGPWARLLVDGFVAGAGEEPDRWPACLPRLQDYWRDGLPSGPYPWYAEAKIRAGAFAAFLGMELGSLSDGTSYDWEAVAVGDVCLFHTRGDELLDAFPIASSADFSSRPRLLGSRSAIAADWERSVLRRCGQAQPGDQLWMMTDALAHWCLYSEESGHNPWRQMAPLLAVADSEEPREWFATWIGELREAKWLRNDDVTLVEVDLR